MTISRRTAFIAALLFLALVAWWFWPERRGDFVNFPPTATGPWVAFGDSLTEGFGASAAEHSYPTVLGRSLGVEIQNHGVSGETSVDGLKRVEDLAALEPRVVLICFGGNDVLRGMPRTQMFANIGAMIDRFHAAGSFVVLIGIRGSGLVGDANAEGFEELAEQKQVKLIPNILDGLLTRPSLMTDYVHPNDAGYAAIAERMEKELRPLLGKLQPNPKSQ
jgi:acyl-CoA thioesterase-1